MKSIFLLPLLMFGFTEAMNAQDYQVNVPHGTGSLNIDGHRNPGEWSEAYEIILPDQGVVLFVRDPEYLYVALLFPEKSIGSLCVRKNDEIRILHASAALGAVVYIQDEDAWKLKEPFRFTLREADDPGNSRQKHADFLASYGWVASTVSMDENEAVPFLEYKIRLDMFDPSRPELGVAGMLIGSDQEIIRLPENLYDGCSSLELIRGFPPEQEQFDSSGWLRLAFED